MHITSSQLKSDIASCRRKNFSLKQATGLMGGGGDPDPLNPSPWICHCCWDSVCNLLAKAKDHCNTLPRVTREEKEGRSILNPVCSFFPFQALGCVLFYLCFMEHPFEDSAKLRILNAKYTIPESDTKYTVFHDLISKYTWINSSTFNLSTLATLGSQDRV